MKKLIITLMIVTLATSLFAQSDYFLPAKGTSLKYSVKVSSPMGEQTLYAKQFLKDLSGDKAITVTEIYKENTFDVPMQAQETVYKVMPDSYNISVKEVMSGNLAQIEDIKILESSGDVVFPKTVKIGQEYPGATMKLEGTTQGMKLTFNIKVGPIKAEANETIEVPAGKFDCVKMTQKTTVEVMGQEQVVETTFWCADGVGMIKKISDMGMASSVEELLSK